MHDRTHTAATALACVLALGACGTVTTEDPLETITSSVPEETSSAGTDNVTEVAVGEPVVLQEGQTVLLDATRVILVAASGPGEDCHDCPLQATVELTTGQTTERLRFSFSGNMAPGQAEQARTATALGWTVRIDRVVDGEAELTIVPGND